jgi:hypothetical protein
VLRAGRFRSSDLALQFVILFLTLGALAATTRLIAARTLAL